jgi:hypothetical protein
MNELCDRSTDRLTQFDRYLDLPDRFYFADRFQKAVLFAENERFDRVN